MKTSIQLKSERAAKLSAIETLINKAQNEKREFSTEENTQFEVLEREVKEFDTLIVSAERVESMKQRSAAAVIIPKDNLGDQENQVKKRFSITKMIREAANGSVTGLEAEMTQEAGREAREAGVGNFTGQASLPSMFISQRAIAKGDGDPPAGGVLIVEDQMDYIESLRPETQLQAMGARMMTNLVGDVALRKSTSNTTATWGTELETAAETGKNFTTVKMSPKRLADFVEISKTLLAQASLDVEAIVMADLRRSIELAVDQAGISGASGGENPVGILNFAGLNAVYAGNTLSNATNADGAALTWEDIVRLESVVAATNKDIVSMGYLVNTKTRGALKTLRKDAGSGLMVWGQGANPLNEYRAGVTNLVPSNLVKGASGSTLSAVIFGDFNDLVIGNWAGIDLIVDPYGDNAKKSQVTVTVASWWDVAARREGSFAAIKDAIA
jgi:HK97 family phage major capsid protein